MIDLDYYLIAVVCLFATGHWIGACVLIGFMLWKAK